VAFDDALHGFRSKRGTGTAILEARLHLDHSIQQGRCLYQLFLDLSKAYDTLDRARTLELLQRYGMGPNLLGLLRNFWVNLQLVPRQGGFYGRPIRSARGVTQGDPLSPIIFNIVVDAVVRAMRAATPGGSMLALFYADDGWLASQQAPVVQEAVDAATDLFARMGLRMNATKTKSMTGHSGNAVHAISTPAFSRRHSGEGETYTARKRRMVACPKCDKPMQERNLAHHPMTQHNCYQRPQKRSRLLHVISQEPRT
jgi:Reverse transcriptase (RNA-dependent DNA polymerase)